MGSELYIDVDEALGRIRGNKTLFVRLLASFENNGSYAALKEALGTGNLEQAAAEAHAIKGMAANLSMKVLYEDAMALEQALRGGDADPERIRRLDDAMEKTKEQVDRLKAEMQ